jgi:hypothetical protein
MAPAVQRSCSLQLRLLELASARDSELDRVLSACAALRARARLKL